MTGRLYCVFGRSAQYCGDGGEGLCALGGAEAAAYFVMDHRLAQRPLRAVVVSRHIGAVQECEQSIAMLQIALAQALTVAGTDRPAQQLIAGSFNRFDLPGKDV